MGSFCFGPGVGWVSETISGVELGLGHWYCIVGLGWVGLGLGSLAGLAVTHPVI